MNMGVGGDLSAAVDALCESPLPFTRDGLEQAMVDLRHQIDRLEVRFSRYAALSAQLEGGDGVPSTYNLGGGQARQRLDVGRELHHLEDSVAALERGGIGFAQLVVIAETSQAIRRHTGKFDESGVLELAREKGLKAFRDACQHLRHTVDPDRFRAFQAAEREEAYLELHMHRYGGASLEGYLDREGAAALKSALEPLAHKSGAFDFRTVEQRRADALVELARHALDGSGLPGRPHLMVTASFETLQGLAGAPAGEMESSVPVCAETIRRIACDCSLTRVVFGPQSQVIDVGRTIRTVSGSRRRALHARDKHCRWPGCERPASWSDAHHLLHWAKNGGSELGNLVLLCSRHHWMAHEGGWQVVKEESGEILAIPPQSPAFSSWIRGPDLVA